ncbi:MAG: Iron-sulfur cluster assembly protein, partial [Solirubrobacteraceae bacterium]|nr:Iron-sulfur cluster assembly protein [Solirubrobacteraceae bacterium]
MPTKEQITEALKAVIDPELRRSIVELDMVRS